MFVKILYITSLKPQTTKRDRTVRETVHDKLQLLPKYWRSNLENYLNGIIFFFFEFFIKHKRNSFAYLCKNQVMHM